MEKRTIWVKPSTFAPEFEMIIPVPTDRDDEEYIDELHIEHMWWRNR